MISDGISMLIRFFVVVISSTDLSKFNLLNVSSTLKYE
jgi:hypothetical protein